MSFTVALPQLEPRERYKLLCATIVPRPIALVTSAGRDGVVNAAPFSFFNVFSEDPPLIVLGLQHKPGKAPKDTTRNIAETGAFVVNLVDEDLAKAMNVCAVDFPPGMSEIEAAGLEILRGVDVQVPRIAQAPFALECRREVALAFGAHRELLVGEVLRLHARDGLIDPERLRVDTDAYHPVGRLFGDGYARQRDRFELKREKYEEWASKPR
ncbi:MAG TPA: flavin reductase family protein [Sphingomicrobium sp.]|nr:flavin reductase family protein [Sphingomicrobium sp.]